MKGYKGFSPELHSVLGDHNPKNCSFRPGITLEAENAKTAREGYHFCEHPFGCLSYYSLDGKNRFFEIEAEGDIDEDANDRLACTKITLIRELGLVEIAMEEIKWLIGHPGLSGWERNYGGAIADKDEAQCGQAQIAIARGQDPRCKGGIGSVLGFIKEDRKGNIISAKLFKVKDQKMAGRWLCLNDRREVVICEEAGDPGASGAKGQS